MDYSPDLIALNVPGDGSLDACDAETEQTGININVAKHSLKSKKLKVRNITSKPWNTFLKEQENVHYGATTSYKDIARAAKNDYTDQLREYCEIHSIVHEYMWRDQIFKDPEAKRIHNKIAMRANYKKLLFSAVENARLMVRPLPYEDRLEKIEQTDITSDKYVKTLAQYRKIIETNKINMKKVFQCMLGEMGKVKTIYFVGEANAGKTSMLKMLSSVYENYEVGKLSAQDIQSNFWLQDLVGKELYCGDEILVSQANIDTIKLLCEGNENLCTEIKFAGKQILPAKPVLIANNVDMCINQQRHAAAIDARTVRYEFNVPKEPLGLMCQEN